MFRPDGLRCNAQPVTGVRLASGDNQRPARAVVVGEFDGVGQRRPAQSLRVRRLPADPPAVGGPVDCDPPRTLLVQRHQAPLLLSDRDALTSTCARRSLAAVATFLLKGERPDPRLSRRRRRCHRCASTSTAPRTAALAPGLSACVSLEEVPPLVRDADPRPGQLGWQVWAEPVVGDPNLWCASFSAGVPHGLAAIFGSSLASPHPCSGPPCRRESRGGSPSFSRGLIDRGEHAGRSEAGQRAIPKLRADCGPNGRQRPPLAGFSRTDQAIRSPCSGAPAPTENRP
ncbi:DUF317 domain-containing protein [Streptomyces sp. NPDC020422]|uniref:DUF317 domain-containing protein n=1 Tax=Streptomyces sp. NPDC020422 TaxID=3365074 RepID=UPI0037AFB744